MSGPKRKPVNIEQLEAVKERLRKATENVTTALTQMKMSDRKVIYIPGLQTLNSVFERAENFASAALGQAFAPEPIVPPEEQMATEIADSHVGKRKTKRPSKKSS